MAASGHGMGSEEHSALLQIVSRGQIVSVYVVVYQGLSLGQGFSYFLWIQESIMMNMLSVGGLLDIHVGIKKVLEHVWLEFRHKVGFDNTYFVETK